jgi:hypothetical protein
MEPAKVVVGMQHLLTTFREKARTTKKSADAFVFCFTAEAGRSRLAAVKELQADCCPRGAGKSD